MHCLRFSSAVWLALSAGVFLIGVPTNRAAAQDIRVTIVSVLANERCSTIDPKLKALAAEVKKRDTGLTGYRIDRTTSKPVTPGQKDSFQLFGDLTADVTVHEREKKCDKIKLTVKAPHVGEITYSTCCGKYFPIMTRYQTEKENERLILAIMAKPQPADHTAPSK